MTFPQYAFDILQTYFFTYLFNGGGGIVNLLEVVVVAELSVRVKVVILLLLKLFNKRGC